jgi:hypothetical protein
MNGNGKKVNVFFGIVIDCRGHKLETFESTRGEQPISTAIF